MYDGMAFIKLYEDASCKNELTRGIFDYYVLKLNVPTGNAFAYNKTIYAKNVGSHKAYNVSVEINQNISDKFSLSAIDKSIVPNGVCSFKVSANFEQGEVGSYAISFDILYDNIP